MKPDKEAVCKMKKNYKNNNEGGENDPSVIISSARTDISCYKTRRGVGRRTHADGLESDATGACSYFLFLFSRRLWRGVVIWDASTQKPSLRPHRTRWNTRRLSAATTALRVFDSDHPRFAVEARDDDSLKQIDICETRKVGLAENKTVPMVLWFSFTTDTTDIDTSEKGRKNK